MHARIAILGRDLLEDRADTYVDHQVGIVTGVMGDRFCLDDVAALHIKHRCETRIEISPMDGFRRRKKFVQAAGNDIFAGIGTIVIERHGDSKK